MFVPDVFLSGEMVRHKLDSLSAFARQGYLARIRCAACGRTRDVDPVAIMTALHGRGASLAIEDIEERLRCRGCGQQGARVSPAMDNR